MKIVKINLPKPYVMAIWSLFVSYVQKDLIEKDSADVMFRLINKLAKLYDEAGKKESIDMLLAYNDAEFIWNVVNQACLSGANDGIITDIKQRVMLCEILTAFAIELDS